MTFQTGVISGWANDGKRFLLEHFDTILKSPSHIYHSALPLSPLSSWLYRHYIAKASPIVKIIKGLPAGWGVCSRTTLLDSFTLTVSHHNNSIAVGSQSGDIFILNTITGSQSGVLSGHTREVNCVVFSSDGTSLVSGNDDRTVKLWDVQTGGVVKTFFGHKNYVYSVSISADSTTVASGSSDATIHVWNVQTGESYRTIQQLDTVFHIILSPTDPQHIISISDERVWQWGANGCQIRPPFDGSHAAFSSNGAQFVSCFEKTITVHNSSTGAISTEFQVADDASKCCFSPDNGLVAVAVGKTAYCWDITASEPKLVETFIGHTGDITSLVFSSSTTLISASEDDSIKFWQIGAQSTDPAIIDPKPTSLLSAPNLAVILQSKEAIALTSDPSGVIRVWDIPTGICKTSCQTPAKNQDRWDAQLVNGRLISIWSEAKRIYAWDGENGELLWEMDIPWAGIEDLKISGGGSWVFGIYMPWIWAWSLQTGEVMKKMDIGNGGGAGYFIVDGSKFWACWGESDYKGWDFGTPGSTPVELPNIPAPPFPSRRWDPEQAKIKNPATGEVVFQLSGRFANPISVRRDNSYLIAGYESGEILILDLTNVK